MAHNGSLNFLSQVTQIVSKCDSLFKASHIVIIDLHLHIYMLYIKPSKNMNLTSGLQLFGELSFTLEKKSSFMYT